MNSILPPGGTSIDPDEAADLIPAGISTLDELNAQEQANIGDAQRWALGRRRKDFPSERLVRELHRRMFRLVWRWAGKYRRSNKNIGVDWPQVPVEVAKLCGDAAYWMEHRSFAADELGVRFHHRLVLIHPFPNGNGRHARLMTDMMMRSLGEPLFTWGSAAELRRAGSAREAYLAALREADAARHYGSLVAFVRS